jgi:cytochrome b6-f complex iron-sulfur subunit
MNEKSQSCDPCVSRREFLTLSGSAVVGVALVGCATTAVYHLPADQGKALVSLKDYPELANVGGMIQLRISSFPDPVILIRKDDQKYLALSAVCTHLRCFVRPSKQFLLCPCHGSTFDLEGNAVRGPAEKPLKRYTVAVSDGTVEIYLG